MNALTDSQRAAGWEPLFDGEHPDKWWRGFRKEEFPEQWEVVDGTIHLREKGGGDIITRQQYRNFIFELEWKNAEGGNSGIFFRVSEDYEQTFFTGPEMQILNDAVHPDAGKPTHRCGANYDMQAPTVPAARPVGEWNAVRVLVVETYVELWLNGVLVVEYELFSDEWNRQLEQSKFTKWPHYGRIETGHIALQDHGDPVWFRNLRIRPLD